MKWFQRIKWMLGNEDGTTITEFVISLPMFIVTFIAIINLGEWGMESTAVRMASQKTMWANAIPVTTSTKADHMSPAAAAAVAGPELVDGAGATDSTAKTVGYGYEGAAMAALGLGGHFGESYYRILPAQAHPDFDVDPVHMLPSDLTDRPFPRKVIDDATADFDRGQGGNVLDIVTEVIGSSGAFQSVGAGIRYGLAFGEGNRTFKLAVIGNKSVEWRNDTLVAPQPLTGLGTKATFGMAWVLAQSQDNYYNLFVFGDGDGLESDGSSSGGAPAGVPNPGDVISEYDAEAATQDDRVGDAEDELEEQQED